MTDSENRRRGKRIVPLEGARNFRDLGGYPTADGRHVKWGALYRSGSLSGLTAGDWRKLRDLGIRTVCDFRTSRERETEPFAWADEDGISYWARDYPVSFAELRETLKSGFATDESAKAGMVAGYRELPFEQAPAYCRLFEHLKANEVPLIFNCAAGKDRAGTAAALILSALGVARELVVEDYALTNEIYDVEGMLRRGESGRLAGRPPAVVAAVARADPAYIEGALDAIEERHGGIAGYLEQMLGVNAAELERIKTNLLGDGVLETSG